MTSSAPFKPPRRPKRLTTECFGMELSAAKPFFGQKAEVSLQRRTTSWNAGTNPPLSCPSILVGGLNVARQAQALGSSIEAARQPATTAHAVEKNKEAKFGRVATTLSVQHSNAESKPLCSQNVGSKVLAAISRYTPPRSRSSNFSSHFSTRQATLQRTAETRLHFLSY